MDAAKRGDREAFGLLAGGAIDRLHGIARLILRDTVGAEDAVQEALTQAWRDLPSLRDPERFDAWLYRLLVRSCADEGRKRRRFEANVRILSAEPSTHDQSGAIADRDQLERGLARLTVDQRSVLVLRFHLDLTLEQIAEALGLPLGTVKSRLHYALEALRIAVEADAALPGASKGLSA